MKLLKTSLLITALFLSTTTAFAGKVGSGQFKGLSGHSSKGSVSVSTSGGKIKIKLGKSFYLDGAPDPYISLGNGSKPVSGGVLQILARKKGAQTYTAATSKVDLSKVNSVIIWCKQYSVPLAVAKIR